MSDGHWQQQEQYHNTFINYHNQAAEETNTDYSEGHRLSTRGARAGALLAEVYSGGPKGGIAPTKVLFLWTKKLVSFCIRRNLCARQRVNFFDLTPICSPVLMMTTVDTKR